jgi:hypothetical protein
MIKIIEHVLNAVEVIHDAGEWVVRVTEGDEVGARSFRMEAAARSYADGQRFRLNLPADSLSMQPSPTELSRDISAEQS